MIVSGGKYYEDEFKHEAGMAMPTMGTTGLGRGEGGPGPNWVHEENFRATPESQNPEEKQDYENAIKEYGDWYNNQLEKGRPIGKTIAPRSDIQTDETPASIQPGQQYAAAGSMKPFYDVYLESDRPPVSKDTLKLEEKAIEEMGSRPESNFEDEVYPFLDKFKLTGGIEDRINKYSKKTGPEKMLETASKGLVEGIYKMVAFPKEVYEGKIDPTSQAGIARATELAGAIVLGPAPIARKAIDGTLGSIAGVGAKTMDKKALDTAKIMDRRGNTANEIWKDTGWFKGAEGQWKYEIPDHNAAFFHPSPLQMKEGANLSEVFSFPELYKAYPEFKDVRVKFTNDPATLGSYFELTKTIELNLGSIPKEDRVKIVLHELQHAIQFKEKFDLGSSPRHSIFKAQDSIVRKVESLGAAGKLKKGDPIPQEIEDLIKLHKEITESGKDKFGRYMYRRNPGELEANTVETRHRWSPGETMMETPLETSRRSAREGIWPPEFRYPKNLSPEIK